jgi:predicted nucleic acid-binding protein
MTKRDFVAAYCVARAGAQKTRTARLRRQERRVREMVAALPLDEWRLARLAAVRHELRERGEELPPIRRGLP